LHRFRIWVQVDDYYCNGLIVLNFDAIGDYYCIGLVAIQCDTWLVLHRKFYVARGIKI
jgi:hypothetical protein